MKHFANNTLRLLLTAIGLSLAGASAYLTAIFLYDLGQSDGYSLVYSISGVLLDMAKTFFPVAAILAYKNGSKLIGSATFLLSLVMMFTSYTISVEALKRSSSILDSQRVEAQHHEQAIKSLESQIETKKDRIERLRAVNYHTEANSLQLEVDSLFEEYRSLLIADIPVSSDGFNLITAKIISALIELTASVSLVVVSAIGRPSVKSPLPLVGSFQDDIAPTAPIAPAVPEKTITETVPPAEVADSEPCTLHDKAKELLAGGQARPSERSLSDAMGIKRPDAAIILNDLENTGFLVRDGRSRVLAT